MSRYNYSDEEKESPRVLEMQKKMLQEQEESLQLHGSRLDEIERDIKSTATQLGVNVQEALNNGDATPELKVSQQDIPSWEELTERANREIDYQPVIEDFLSQQEIEYSLDEIKSIKREFQKKTKLNKRDLSFLIIATALQTLRWIIINQIMGDIQIDVGKPIDISTRESEDSGDKKKKLASNAFNEKQEDRENIQSKKDYPTWKDIVFGQYKRDDGRGKSKFSCPYDAQANAPKGFDDGGKGAHRANTLGHDPILGWIFGTANIMTCTISLSKKFFFRTYRVLYPGARFGMLTSWPIMFKEVYESTMEDRFRLPAAIFAQGAHLMSDKKTYRGLPVPLLEVFTDDYAGKLYNEYYDSLCLVRDAKNIGSALKTVGTQAVVSIVINMLVILIHGLFYNQEKDESRDMYEVRTRKIILYSNSLASAGNIAYAAATQDWGKLDVGGILVTVTRLFSDIRFITRMKHEFIQRELDKSLQEELEIINQYFE